MSELSCTFCSEFLNPENSEFRNYVSREVLLSRNIIETKDFIALVSLGALTPGYLLLLPKKHYFSFALMSRKEIIEAEILKEKLKILLEKKYGSIIIFEHGMMSGNSSVGGCVDHAHLQFVPCQTDLFSTLEKIFLY